MNTLRPLYRTLVCAAALVLATAAGAGAQDLLLFGDVEASAQETVSSSDAGAAALGGFPASTQYLTGRLALHINSRLSFDSGELYVDDSFAALPGADGTAFTNDLTQAYISLSPLPELTLVVGKRRLSWGAGYAFFPGDLINPPSNPGNRSEGFYGITATVSPSASFTLTAAVRLDTAFPSLSSLPGFVSQGPGTDMASLLFLSPYVPAAPANRWASARYVLYSDLLLGNLDTYAAVTWQWQKLLRPAAGFSLDLGGVIANGELALELDNTDLYPAGSAGYSSPGFGKVYPVATVGLQRIFSSDNGSYGVTLEYLYDGTGYDVTQARRFYDDLADSLSAPPDSSLATSVLAAGTSGSAWFSEGSIVPSLGRHYAAVSLSASATRIVTATAAGVVNLQDGSFALQPEVRITKMQGIDLFIRGVVAWGWNSRTEFGLISTPVTVSTGATVHF